MGQVMPTSRRVTYACILTAAPVLYEPYFLVDIQVPQDAMGGCYGVLSGRRGHVFSEEQRPGTPMMQLRAYLPVKESFGFDTELRAATGGKAFPQCVFDHWAVVSGDPLDPGQLAGKMAEETRKRKGLKIEVPTQWSSACSNLNAWLADNVPREGEAATLRWEVVLYTAQAVTSAGMEYTYTAGIVLVIRTEGDDTPDPTDDSIDPRNGEVLSPDQLHARRAQRRANMLSADAADVGAPQPEIMQQDAVAPEQVAVAVRTAPTPPSDPVVTNLKQAKELLDAGVLTREEFDTLKNEFLNAGTEWTW